MSLSFIICFMLLTIGIPQIPPGKANELWTSDSEGAPSAEAPHKSTPESRVTIISVPGLSFLELQSNYLARLPHLRAFIASGAIAAMNIRTPERGLEDSYLSIGSSAPASIPSTLQAWHRDEHTATGTILQWYARYHGKQAESGELLVPDITYMQQMNRKLGSHIQIGLLGTILQQNNIPTYVYGDLLYAPFLLMDDKGVVNYGEIGQRLLIPDADRATSETTNYDRILNLWQSTPTPSVIVLELGNLQRLYEEQRSYDQQVFERSKQQVLQELDEFIGKLHASLQPTDQLWLFSPIVNQDAWNIRWMFSPLIMSSGGYTGDITSTTSTFSEQMIFSPSTRRQGIVSMYDLAPTILTQLNLPHPAAMIGMPLQRTNKDDALQHLLQLNSDIAQVYKLRPQLLYPFVSYQIVVLLVSLLMVLLQWRNGIRSTTLPLYTLILSPLGMLLMGWLVKLGWSTQGLLVFFIFFLIIGSWLAVQYSVYTSLVTICALTVMTLFIDGFTGAHAMKSSVLGYDPMIGARYYGVGNEYMGVWIGAAVLGVSAGMHFNKWKKIAAVASGLLFAAILIYMASPSWGTNAGGAITAGVAFGLAWLRLFSRRIQLQVHWGRLLMWVTLFAGAALIGLWLLNGGGRTTNESQSHIGRAMDHLLAGRFDLIGGIVWRKLMMNIHLIGVSVWSKALLTSLLVMAVLVMKPAGIFRRWQHTHGPLMHGLSAIATGAIIALLVNDSGIVAAATMMVFVAIPMLLIRLQEMAESYSDKVSHSA
jgi:hypothetical protein